MKQFQYTITDPMGLHARPAGVMAKQVKGYVGTTVTVTKGDKSVNALKLMGLMSMAVKQGETVTIRKITGRDEVRRRLEELGFAVGSAVTVVSGIAGNLILQVKDTRVALDWTMANRIIL